MHLPELLGKTAIPFLRKYVVPAAERVGADLADFAAPEKVVEKVSRARQRV